MDIIVVSRRRNRTWRFAINPQRWWVVPPLMLVIGTLGGSFLAGWLARGDSVAMSPELIASWNREAEAQRLALSEARRSADENTEALTRRIAMLQAHVIRLDAAGNRMTEIAGIDPREFSFDQDPPIGGPAEADAAAPSASDPVVEALDALEEQLAVRERQMRVLEDLLLASRMQRDVNPSGWPVEHGYISSVFGLRRDPFTGRRAMHEGIDFAGRSGSGVLSVAAGVITYAGPRDGYGQLVEINHGNGYVTRYGHNKKILVEVGDRVLKGQRVSLMGSSGRSTGPHVHFEVLLNGKVVNPAQYIQAAQ
jgi:murein DD-endopeptidase MepM/ murein hydrolase activator NlpD